MNKNKTDELPKGWAWTTISDIVGTKGVFVDGDWVESKDQDPSGDVRLIQLADIGDGEYRNKSERFLKYEKAIDLCCTFLKKEDVLIARMPDPLGRSCIFPGDLKKSVTVVDVAIVRPGNTDFETKWLMNFLNAPAFRSAVASLQSGSTRKRISRSNLATISFPLPPLPEQHAIVSKIEQLFSELDKGIESLKTAQQQLKVYRQSVLKWAFDKSIGAESVPVVRLEQVCEFITKGTTPSKGKLYFQSGEIPFIKVYNLTFNGSLDFSIAPTFISKETHGGFLSRSKVIPGDVLMNIVGPPLGKVSIVPNIFSAWNINQAIVRFRCKESLLNKYLAHYLLSATTINRYSKKAKATAGQFNLTLEICRDIKIPLPSVAEQHQIVQEIESRLSECDNMETTIAVSLQQAEALRQSILKKAFEGRLLNESELEAVRQDPAWEPAERLLERIRAEKAVLHSGKKGRKSKV